MAAGLQAVPEFSRRAEPVRSADVSISIAVVILGGAIITDIFVFCGCGNDNPQEKQSRGALLFEQKGCAQCHYVDSTAKKAGPGLKDVLKAENLPASGRPSTREYIRKQLVDPYENMPSYEDRLTEEQMQQLLDYLETL